MRNDARNGGRAPRDGEALDPQPAPRNGAEIALARAVIRPLADSAYESPRTLASSERATSNAPFYVGVRSKFAVALLASGAWFAATLLIALPWIAQLSSHVGTALAWLVIGAIALVPGFMNAFLIASVLLDRRPARSVPSRYPAISILIPTCNDEASIADTIRSIANQDYPGAFEVYVVDDASDDRSAAIVGGCDHDWLHLVRQPMRSGKSAALNRGLAEAHFDLIVTLDADSFLYRDALRNLVERYLSDPPNTRAVAGTMLVRNSRRTWVTKAQEWDYFHGIAAIKRVQSLYQGTLVAQDACSLYERAALRDVGGWADCEGQDVVLTWAMLRRGWRVGHAEDACCFTNAPTTLRALVRQRQRWARGMVEAFRRFPDILVVPRLSTLFVWWNLLLPWIDLTYTVLFVPGVVLALFGVWWIAGPLTLALLPMAVAINYAMYRVGSQMFASNGLRVRRNLSGFLTYAFVYSLVLQPACAAGYFSEILGGGRDRGIRS
ncbi:MAG TPA: glycosyltransferase family 2 protein [Casimicrobiaceae bacterium]|jgi:biofilm PGA synthesis N-glycosyltransferase PgaC|nr:glycosyltransferase family 2 protein [Casimicrobiaceae bacterium]